MIAILWLHAFPLTAEMFAAQHAIPGVQHITPDLPGFGVTPPLAGEPDMDAYARFAVEQLDARGIGRAVFAGVSMGGYVAMTALRNYRDRIAGLILIDTRETADTAEGRAGRFEMIAKIEREGVSPLVESMAPKMLTAAAPAEMKKRVRAMMLATPARGATDALAAMAGRDDSKALLAEVDVPTLIVVGDEDTITPPADAERMAGMVRGARLATIPEAAHLPNVEQPYAFNKAVTEFLRLHGTHA